MKLDDGGARSTKPPSLFADRIAVGVEKRDFTVGELTRAGLDLLAVATGISATNARRFCGVPADHSGSSLG